MGSNMKKKKEKTSEQSSDGLEMQGISKNKITSLN
jgi:hypothetical protein